MAHATMSSSFAVQIFSTLVVPLSVPDVRMLSLQPENIIVQASIAAIAAVLFFIFIRSFLKMCSRIFV